MRLRLISGTNVDIPVTFPPGRARFTTTPSRTGSELLVMTIGMLVVAFLAAHRDGRATDATLGDSPKSIEDN